MMKHDKNGTKDLQSLLPTASPFDIRQFQKLLQQGQYSDALSMLEGWQHPALAELKHRAKIRKTLDSMYIEDVEIPPRDTFNLIQVIKRQHVIELSVRIFLISCGIVAISIAIYTMINWSMGQSGDPSDLCTIPIGVFLIAVGTLRTPDKN